MKTQKIQLSILSGAIILALQSQTVLAQGNKIETITVTSQKRIERLIEVPISVTNISELELSQRGIKQLRDVQDLAPNLQMSQGSDFNASIMIRGVGANSRNIGFDSRVGVYIDGVYLGQSPAINQGLVDLERVEVLRGPQGTLFGKNAIAGAINLISKKPSQALDGKVSLNVGNFGTRELSAQLNLPLGEETSANVFVNQFEQQGHVYNALTDEHVGGKDGVAARINVVSTLSERLDLSFSADTTNQDRLALGGVSLTGPLGGHPSQGAFGDVLNGTASDKYTSFQDRDMDENKSIWGGSLTLDYSFDNDFSFKSITAYRDTQIEIGIDADYSSLGLVETEYDDHYQQTSQEFQLISPQQDGFDYIVGLYLFSLDSSTTRDAFGGAHVGYFGDPRISAFQQVIASSGDIKTSSYALFGNANWQLSQALKLGVGLRYSHEEKSVDWNIDGSNSGFFNIATGDVEDKRSDAALSPSVNLNYAINDNSQAYARVSTGFKSGGYNLDFVTSELLSEGVEFNEESVVSYEIGYKTEMLDNRLRLNSSIFIANYDDYQVNQYVNLGGGRTALSITNAAKVTTQGLELELAYQATDDFSIMGSLGLLDATFDKFDGAGAQGGSADGNYLPNAPELTASISGQYYVPLPSLSSTLLLRGDYNYSGEQFFNVQNDRDYPLPDGTTVDYGLGDSYSTVNARISLLSDNGFWEFSLWGKNLADSDHLTYSAREFLGAVIGSYAMPRSYGVEATFNF